jgi:hypothetical protein
VPVGFCRLPHIAVLLGITDTSVLVVGLAMIVSVTIIRLILETRMEDGQ